MHGFSSVVYAYQLGIIPHNIKGRVAECFEYVQCYLEEYCIQIIMLWKGRWYSSIFLPSTRKIV